MVSNHYQKATEHETQIQIALQGLADGTYISTDQAVKALGVSKTRLIHHVKEGKSKWDSQKALCLLFSQEEKALVDWISNATAVGNPVNQQDIKKMLEEMRWSCVGMNIQFL